MQLIEDAHEGDVILVEQIDRLARLNPEDWETLKKMLSEKNLPVVSKELPTSYMALKSAGSTDFMSSSLKAINSMLLDMLTAIARKDYEDRRHRQQKVNMWAVSLIVISTKLLPVYLKQATATQTFKRRQSVRGN